jgi:hypothetical protein
MNKLRLTHERVVLLVLVVLVLTLGFVNPRFFSTASVFSLLKGSVIRGLLALGDRDHDAQLRAEPPPGAAQEGVMTRREDQS